MNKFIIAALLLLLGAHGLWAQESPFNGLEPQVDSGQTDYTFLVSGHFYGGSQNVSGYPASTLLANLEEVNQSEAAFMVCVGDLFQDVRNNIPAFRKALFEKLDIPLYNAVGNHDLSGDVYQENFGDTWYTLKYLGDVFVILDSELNSSSFKGDQLDLLLNSIKQADSGSNIFVFSHRPVWAEAREELAGVFPDNTQSATGTNYLTEVEPTLSAHDGSVFWFSGSMGGMAPVSFFYHHPDQTNLHFIQTAIRDLPRDAMLYVHVKSGEVSFETWSLTGQELEPLESYDLEFWRGYRKPAEFNYRLIPLYVGQMLSDAHFWWGVGLTIFGLITLRWMRRRRRNRRSKKSS